ncbi:HAD family hydrolase [Fundidesulfovibrio butyratiphilus]
MSLSAVVFDFDGTLARPALDFTLMKHRLADLARARFGDPLPEVGGPALEWIEAVTAARTREEARSFRDQAHGLIADMELEAAARTSLFPFVRDVLTRLKSLGAGLAIITRNIRRSVDMVFPDVLDFVDAVLTREDVAAVKPDPAHLLAALAVLGVPADRALMVGDHPQDVLTARRAGTLSAAVTSGGNDPARLRQSGPDFFEPDVAALVDRLVREGRFASQARVRRAG